MKFTKKPVTIDAVQWTGDLKPIANLVGDEKILVSREDTLFIRTLEGDMKANLGDWIIKGIHGECYPCKPEIFEKTYTPANQNQDLLQVAQEKAPKHSGTSAYRNSYVKGFMDGAQYALNTHHDISAEP